MLNYNNNENLEQVVLGAIILDKDYLPEVMGIIANSDVFELPQHRTIFDVIRQKYDTGETIDIVTLSQAPQLRSQVAYLIDLTQSAGTGVNCVSHSHLLIEQYMKRKLSVFAIELQNKVQGSEDVADVLGWVQLQIDSITNMVANISAPKHISKVLHEALNEAEARYNAHKRGETVGIPTGLTELDMVTGGWRGGQLVVIAGRPAMGKSAVMLHFAKSAAKQGVPVVIFSLEMQGRELGDRLIMGNAQIDPNRYKIADISSEEWVVLENANSAISRLPLSIADSSAVTMQKIRAQSQQLKAKGKCGMIIIDYLQLLDMQTRNRSASREQEVSAATRQAKVLANELDVPIVLLSQLSRKVEERADKTPMLSDLRESGAIEQDADMVVFIHRPYYYDRDAKIESSKYGSISPEGVGVLTVAKQRNGRIGQLYFKHSPDLNSIMDYECNFNNT